MACILHIETATEGCSVAVSQDTAVIYAANSKELEEEQAADEEQKGKKSLSGHAGTLGELSGLSQIRRPDLRQCGRLQFRALRR